MTVDIKLLALYFFVGGVIVSATAYFGSQSKGLLAAFIAFIPGATVITICAIYFAGGVDATLSYARGMLLLLPSWTLYVVLFIFLLPRLGLAPALTISIVAYISTALLVMKLF